MKICEASYIRECVGYSSERQVRLRAVYVCTHCPMPARAS